MSPYRDILHSMTSDSKWENHPVNVLMESRGTNLQIFVHDVLEAGQSFERLPHLINFWCVAAFDLNDSADLAPSARTLRRWFT